MLKLPRLISEGCVLQQGETINIQGWCDPQAGVTVTLGGCKASGKADTAGIWEIRLHNLPSGGPYPMVVTADGGQQVALSEVYIGEVWLTSGQSNMQLPVERVKDSYSSALLTGSNPWIRFFTVKERYEFHKPLCDFEEGMWKSYNPESIREFSAFSFFFASYLQEKTGTPVGIINSSVGGSRIEAWMGRDALKDYPEYLEAADQFQDEDVRQKFMEDSERKQTRWLEQLEKAEDCGEGAEGWRDILLPGFFDDRGIRDFSGVLYLRKRCRIPFSMAGKPAGLWLGTMVDSDRTYVNGTLVGETGYQYPPRKYQVPEGLLKPGENDIRIRLVCKAGNGRVTPGKKMKLFCEETEVDLSGLWQARIGCRCLPAPEEDFIWRKPTGLYHGMLAPCQSFGVRGVVWYQGESNDRMAEQYEGLLKRMIESWRQQWRQEHLPFIIVQLPGFSIDLPEKGSGWPEIREAQSHAGHFEETAVTVNLDLGEANDLHPQKKKEAAFRAALAVRGMVYGEDITWKSPVMQSWKVEGCDRSQGRNQEGSQDGSREGSQGGNQEGSRGGNQEGSQEGSRGGNREGNQEGNQGGNRDENQDRIQERHGTYTVRIWFDTGDNKDLITIDGSMPGEFQIAGEDRVFYPAEGEIRGNQVVISGITRRPAAVRYAWSNAPEKGLLYNQSGLPAQPFRTDDWT